jgi:hypothetical protein
MGSTQECRGLSPLEAANWLVHSRKGRIWARDAAGR